MNKLIKILAIFSVFALLGKSGLCYTLTDKELTNVINLKLKQEIKEQLKEYPFVGQNDFKVTISGIPNAVITTNENTIPKIELSGQVGSFQKNSAKRVIIKDSKGNLIKAFPINVQTSVFANVLTAKNTIAFNNEITKDNTKFEKKEISSCLNRVLVDFKDNAVSKRNFQAGNIILSDSIKEKSAVLKDSVVDIIFLSNNGLKIKIQGRALKEGSIGDIISVRSDKFNKIYNAKVNSSNEVTVKI